jgi:hypothetical protein
MLAFSMVFRLLGLPTVLVLTSGDERTVTTTSDFSSAPVIPTTTNVTGCC